MSKAAFNEIIAEQAAQWVVQLDEGEISPKAKTKLVNWLRKSPLHIDEFIQACVLYDAIQYIDLANEIPAVLETNDVKNVRSISASVPLKNRKADTDAPGTRHSSFRLLYGAAASIVICICLALYITVIDINSGVDGNAPNAFYSTERGEQRSLVLEDGTLVNMNTLSRIEVDFNEDYRDVTLHEGEAVFSVVHDATRPLRVWSGDTITQVLGTEFNIRRNAQITTVTVITGKVLVSDHLAGVSIQKTRNDIGVLSEVEDTVLLTAGDEIVLGGSDSTGQKVKSNLTKRLSWRERKLIFSGESLQEVVTEFNRYNTTQLTIEGQDTAELSISGVFTTTNPKNLLEFLENSGDLQVTRVNADKIVIRQIK